MDWPWHHEPPPLWRQRNVIVAVALALLAIAVLASRRDPLLSWLQIPTKEKQ